MTAPLSCMDLQSLILVVDDDPDLRRLITEFLYGHGYRVAEAGNVEEMWQAIARQPPDLVILDVMMPGGDGLTAARRLASEHGPPVIMLSALGSDTDRIIGLEVGADDYVAKPCNPRELLARVRARLRRRASAEVSGSAGRLFEFAGWKLDVLRRELRDPTGILIDLSEGEFSLLRSFIEHPQRVLSRDQLLDFAQGRGREVYDRAIDSQISRLRRKLNDRTAVELIRTVRNSGYMLVPKVTAL
ncbi:MAG TPA: response regulator transcription factor [Steroidobacteraceae bacterium]|nr:response regulator transcription factor [Steroidobacteraceae bacterium]